MTYEDGKVLVDGREGWRYTWPPEPPFELIVPGVSTILDNQSAVALNKWKLKNAASFAVENVLEWETLPAEEAIDRIVKASEGDGKAADRGTAIHAAIEAYQDGIPEVEPDLLPYVQAGLAFLGDHVEKVGVAETPFFSRTYKYAGTPDALVKLKDGRYAIVDWKSGSRIYSSTALQLAAYARAEFIGFPDGREVRLDKDITVGIVVHLKENGTYIARFCDITDRLFGIFRALRNLQLWRDEIEPSVWTEKVTGQATATAAS